MARKVKKKSGFITEFDSENLDEVRKELKGVLDEVGKRFDLKIALGGFRYGSFRFTTRMTVEVKSTSSGESLNEREWRENLWKFSSLKPAWFGKTFKDDQGVLMKIVGFRPRSRKYPVVLEGPEGQTYRAPVSWVAEKMKG